MVGASCGVARDRPLVCPPADAQQSRSHIRQKWRCPMSAPEVVLCNPVRTAIGAYNGSLKAIPATDLGATVVRETLRRSGLDAAAIGSVLMGNVVQAGNKMNPARQAAIGGGLPVSVPAMTVNRVCGSGAQAVVSAAQEILLGNAEVSIAG